MNLARNLPSDQLIEAAQLELQLAREALHRGDKEQAWNSFFQVLGRLSSNSREHDGEVLFASTCLEFSNLCFLLGRGFSSAINFLQDAKQAAETIGDQRSGALVKLHLGQLYYFAERRSEASELFVQGKAEVEALGDEDILTEAAEFIGLYYFIQGRFKEAQDWFESAARSFEGEKWEQIINPSGPMWLSYCAAYLGQYHRAIGTLDYYRRLALERGDKTLATTFRSVLGIILLYIKKTNEGSFHLSGALQESNKTNNALARYFAKGGLAYHHLLEGRLGEAREWLNLAVMEGATSGLVRQYASPFAIEMLFEFHRQGLAPIPQLHFHGELDRIMQEANIHLRGVALRLRAAETAMGGGSQEAVESDLKQSEDYLVSSGDPIQLAKTRLAMARLHLQLGNREKARTLAQRAWKGFSGYGDVFYPDDLRKLLTVKSEPSIDLDSRDEILNLFMEMIQGLEPSEDLNRLLTHTVTATNRFFGAERGGIFWFARGCSQKSPVLRAACNLSRGDVASKDFHSSLSLIFKAKRENTPQVVRHEGAGRWPSQIKALLAVPFEVGDQERGVLYHDNSYVNDCFELFEKSQLAQMARALTVYIDKLVGFTQRLEQRATSTLHSLGRIDSPEIITGNKKMQEILKQADRIAGTDSTVLILGETGVGKELLAHRLYNLSSRSNKPFIIVDLTTIPENLVESELFGHEKGAFTGADVRKTGRMELAHQGTLFIDEVGEIPKSIQVKLLRALQEKTITRLGGNQTIKTDFRLIAATNRDLAAEVASGHFREDLYYRLNVVPLTLPPLRERSEDVLLLAGNFLNRFALKYNRPGIKFSREDEEKLMAYAWPGNVRELNNLIERTILLSSDDGIELSLPGGKNIAPKTFMADCPTMDEMQRQYIQYVLEVTRGKLGGPGGAAEVLGMKRTSLINRMKKLGLR